METDILVGADYLKETDMTLCMGKGLLQLPDGQRAEFVRLPRPLTRSMKINVAKTTIVQPNTVTFLRGKIGRNRAKDRHHQTTTKGRFSGILEPHYRSDKGVAIPRTAVYSEDGKVVVKCINFEDRPVTLHRYDLIAMMQPLNCGWDSMMSSVSGLHVIDKKEHENQAGAYITPSLDCSKAGAYITPSLDYNKAGAYITPSLDYNKAGAYITPSLDYSKAGAYITPSLDYNKAGAYITPSLDCSKAGAYITPSLDYNKAGAYITPSLDYNKAGAYITPSLDCNKAGAYITPSLDYNKAGAYITPSLDYNKAGAYITPSLDYNKAGAYITPSLDYNKAGAYITPSLDYNKAKGETTSQLKVQQQAELDVELESHVMSLGQREVIQEEDNSTAWKREEFFKQLHLDKAEGSKEEVKALGEILWKWRNVFSKNKDDIGPGCNFFEAKIDLKKDYQAQWVPCRPTPYKQKEALNQELKKLLKSGVVVDCG